MKHSTRSAKIRSKTQYFQEMPKALCSVLFYCVFVSVFSVFLLMF